jgi:hypothetical protein
MASDRKGHRRFGKESRSSRARRTTLHRRVSLQSHLGGPEKAKTSEVERGLPASKLMYFFLVAGDSNAPNVFRLAFRVVLAHLA